MCLRSLVGVTWHESWRDNGFGLQAGNVVIASALAAWSLFFVEQGANVLLVANDAFFDSRRGAGGALGHRRDLSST
jgi:hypothetical protein